MQQVFAKLDGDRFVKSESFRKTGRKIFAGKRGAADAVHVMRVFLL